MAFFDFLHDANTEKKVIGKAFNFIGNFLPGNRQYRGVQQKSRDIVESIKNDPNISRQLSRDPQFAEKVQKLDEFAAGPDIATKARDFGVSAARSVARFPETLVRSDIQASADIANKAGRGDKMDLSSGEVTDPIRKFLYGKEKIETYQKRTEGNKKVIEGSRFRDASTPLSFLALGLTVGGDATGLPGGAKKAVGKEVTETLLTKLAKETSEAGVKKLLSRSVAPEVAERVARGVAMTKDKNVVRNILAKEAPDVFTAGKAIVNAPEKEIVDGYAQTLQDMESVSRGGDMIPTADGGYKRITSHSTFYRNYYSEYGRAPSKAAWREEAIRQLKSGNADPAFQPFYDDAVNPEVQSLVSQTPEVPLTPEEQSILSAKQLSQDANAPAIAGDTRIAAEGTGRTKTRGFADTVETADTVQPTAKQVVEASANKEYRQLQNEPGFEKAKALVESDYDAAMARLDSNNLNTVAEDNIVGNVLLHKALLENRTDDAVQIMEKLAQRYTTTGQGSQVAAMWARMTPEGLLKIAEHDIRKAREGIKGGKIAAKELGTAEELKNAVEGGVKVDKGDVDKTIKSIIDDVDAEEATVAQKVAGRVEKAVLPAKKKKVDMLVEEITKKIKQEELAPVEKAAKKSPTDVLKEVFARNKEAQDAYPEVKAILQERFAGNTKALEALDKFFKSDLPMPTASSTINSAIKEQLIKNGTKIREVIFKSYSTQKTSVDDIARNLVAEGFDETSAKSLADEVVKRLNSQLGDAKKSILEQMTREIPERAKASLIAKIEKLSNLGALEDSDYLTLARAKLNLPDLTSEVAAKINTLAQKMQDLPAGAERDDVLHDIMNTINEAIPVTRKEKFTAYRYQNILSGPRSQLRNTTTNALQTLVTRPATKAIKAGDDWVKSIVTGSEREHYLKEVPEYYRGLIGNVSDAFENMKKAWNGRIDVQNPDLLKSGMLRGNQIPKKYTFITRAMEAQDRFFQTLISSGEYASQRAKGVSHEVAIDSAEKIARNSLFRSPTDAKNLSGQGALLSNIDKATDAIQASMTKVPALRWFAPFVSTPMNITKQFIEYSPVGFATLYKAGGDKKAEQFAKAIIGTTVTAMGAKLALDGRTTWAAPTNPKERDAFYASGKKPYSVKVGDKWVPMIMFGPFAYALALPASIKDANDSAALDDSQLDKLSSVLTGQAKFFAGQSYVQGLSSFVDIISGNEDGANAKTAVASLIGQAIPLEGLKKYVTTTIDPVYRKKETFIDQFRSSTPFASKKLDPYTDPDTGAPSKRNISDYVLPYSYGKATGDAPTKRQKEAVSEFYKVKSKTGSARTKVNEQISLALKAGDTAKAREIAADYNKRYAATFKKWVDKYGDSTNAELQKEYSSGKIKLTSTTIRSRRRTIKNKESQRSIYAAVRGQ